LSKLPFEDGLAVKNQGLNLPENSIISNSLNSPTHSYNNLREKKEATTGFLRIPEFQEDLLLAE
jgi:hypothetical protein